MIPAVPNQDLREGGWMILRGWIPIHFSGWASGDLQRSRLPELRLFNGSLKAQVQASCPAFQYVQWRERKAPLEGNSFQALRLPLAQGAQAPACLQVPGAGWIQAFPGWLSRLQVLRLRRGCCIAIQSAKRFLLTHLPVFSSRFFPLKTFLVPFLVGLRIRRIPSVSLGAAVLHAFSKTQAEKVLFPG